MEKYPEYQSVELLVKKLEHIELEVRTPVPVEENIWTKVFGETSNARRRREKEQQRKALSLREQRIAIINSFIPPDDIEGLLRLGQIAIASYPAAPSNAERIAWRVKLHQCVQMIDAAAMEAPSTISNLDVKLAYLRGELQKIEDKERSEKRLAIQEIAFTASALVAGIAMANLTDGVSVALAIFGSLVYWLGIRKKMR